MSRCRQPKFARSPTVYSKKLTRRIANRGIAVFSSLTSCFRLAQPRSWGCRSLMSSRRSWPRSRARFKSSSVLAKAMRWLGKQLGATAVLVGTTEDEGDSVRVQVNLRSCEKEKAGPVEGFTFPYAGSKDPFTALDFPAKAASVDNSSTDPAVFRARAGVGGVTSPICLYCPQPSYTNPARAAKFQGTMLLDVIVSPDGEMKSASFIRGLPFGLNDKAVEALRRWKFRPATLNAQPVMVKVQIEVTFRLY